MFFLLLNAKVPQPETQIPLCQISTLRYIIIRKSVQEEGVAGFLNYYSAGDYTWKVVIQEEQEPHNEMPDTDSKHLFKTKQFCSLFLLVSTHSPGMLNFPSVFSLLGLKTI